MWNLGFPEIVIIFIVALVIFGPRKLPELGRSLGKGLSEFKRASNELKRTWEDEVEAVKHEVDVEQDELKKIQTDLE
jgi:TatA/E family protein of Tat protein translocase